MFIMPKKKKKQAVNTAGKHEEVLPDDIDKASVMSTASSGSYPPAPETVIPDPDELLVNSEEDKVIEFIELLSEKRTETRVKALKGIAGSFRNSYLALQPNWSHTITLISGLERCVRKGKDEEQSLGVDCFSLLCLQLDADELPQELAEFKQFLLTLLKDANSSLRARSSACLALALGTFITPTTDNSQLKEMLNALEGVFSGSYLKGDGTVRQNSPELCELHASALDSWCFLFTLAERQLVQDAISKQLPKFIQVLHSCDVDIRIIAGQAIALLYEGAYETMPSFKPPKLPDMKETMKELSTDGAKNRSKVDRRRQRANFRDIFSYITASEFSEETIKFGPSHEELDLMDWSAKIRYHFFCHVLQNGVNVHLEQNELLRSIFNLGSPIPRLQLTPGSKISKSERRWLLQANEKCLKQSRNAQRTKRQLRLSTSD